MARMNLHAIVSAFDRSIRDEIRRSARRRRVRSRHHRGRHGPRGHHSPAPPVQQPGPSTQVVLVEMVAPAPPAPSFVAPHMPSFVAPPTSCFSLDLRRHSWEKKMTSMTDWFHRQHRRTTAACARPLHHCILNSQHRLHHTKIWCTSSPWLWPDFNQGLGSGADGGGAAVADHRCEDRAHGSSDGGRD